VNIKPEVLTTVEKAVTETVFGAITLIVQDGILIQMEKVEKVRFVSDKGNGPLNTAKKISGEAVRNQILSALAGLKYGQVALIIKDRTIVQIERTEKHRYPSLEGIYGEGI
jgi:hypothetical protein